MERSGDGADGESDDCVHRFMGKVEDRGLIEINCLFQCLIVHRFAVKILVNQGAFDLIVPLQRDVQRQRRVLTIARKRRCGLKPFRQICAYYRGILIDQVYLYIKRYHFPDLRPERGLEQNQRFFGRH